MNPLPPNADELVSAYLDGQAAPDEVAVVESNAELMERVEDMRRVADLVGEPTTPPPAQKEAHISAALDAFDALFAEEVTTAPLDAVPLSSVPTVIQTESEKLDPNLSATPPAPATPPSSVPRSDRVASLDAVRERRRPRRFSVGIIAAAVAMVLFVVVAAFGFGGGDSTNTASFDSSASTQLETSDNSSDDAGDDAMDDEEAMADEESPALSEVEARDAPSAAAAQAPEADAIEAAEDEAMDGEEEAMADEEAMDDDDAMAEDAMDDGAGDSAGETGVAGLQLLDPESFQLFSRAFTDTDELLVELEGLPDSAVTQRIDLLTPGLFPSCQESVPELAEIGEPTLVGGALVAGEPVEVHQIIDGDEVILVIVDPAANCSILTQSPEPTP